LFFSLLIVPPPSRTRPQVFRKASHPATLLLRSLAAGVILSLAIIHVIPEGAADLEGLYDGPLAPCMVFAGIVMMAVTENLWYYFASRREVERGQVATPDGKAVAADYSDGAEPSCPCCPPKVSPADDAPTPAVTAYIFELACIVHCFLIGFTLGVTTDRSQAVTLTIGIVSAQLLEAISMGTVIVKARFSMRKSVIMVTTFALTVPLSIAIGMGVATSYNNESTGALTVQGIFNSISGGLLLYIALVHMSSGLLVRIGMYFMIALGATFMILIAMFGEGDAHNH
jgi:zinc transporter 1/2/3